MIVTTSFSESDMTGSCYKPFLAQQIMIHSNRDTYLLILIATQVQLKVYGLCYIENHYYLI